MPTVTQKYGEAYAHAAAASSSHVAAFPKCAPWNIAGFQSALLNGISYPKNIHAGRFTIVKSAHAYLVQVDGVVSECNELVASVKLENGVWTAQAGRTKLMVGEVK